MFVDGKWFQGETEYQHWKDGWRYSEESIQALEKEWERTFGNKMRDLEMGMWITDGKPVSGD